MEVETPFTRGKYTSETISTRMDAPPGSIRRRIPFMADRSPRWQSRPAPHLPGHHRLGDAHEARVTASGSTPQRLHPRFHTAITFVQTNGNTRPSGFE